MLVVGCLVAFFVTVLLFPPFIRLIRSFGMGKRIRVDGPESHYSKEGTPTMGGLLIILVVAALAAVMEIVRGWGNFIDAGTFAPLATLLLVGAPAVLMGGTLPVLVRALAADPGQLGRAGGRLYAANTAGAIAGTLLSAFVLIATLGVRGSALAAALLNLLAALGALALRQQQALPASAPAKLTSNPRPARLALLLYSLAGGVALGYEVVWSQSIVPFMSTRTYAFAVVLATYLGGLFLGSSLMAPRADRVRDPWGLFGLLIALLVLPLYVPTLVFGMAAINGLLGGTGTGSAFLILTALSLISAVLSPLAAAAALRVQMQ